MPPRCFPGRGLGCRTLAFFKGAGFLHAKTRWSAVFGQGDLHFITFSCVRRRPLLGTVAARDCFVRILNEVRNRYAFRLIGYVVMPEHVHLLISESGIANPSKAVQVLKQRVSSVLLEKRRSSLRRAEDHFWQRRFYDFNVYTGRKITEKLNYMHLKSGEATARSSPKRLAVEQLVTLCQQRTCFDPGRRVGRSCRWDGNPHP